MADFSTWAAMLAAVRNQIANRDLAVGEYRTPDGTSVRYRSLDELIRLEAWVSVKAAAEAAPAGVPSRRVHVTVQGDAW